MSSCSPAAVTQPLRCSSTVCEVNFRVHWTMSQRSCFLLFLLNWLSLREMIRSGRIKLFFLISRTFDVKIKYLRSLFCPIFVVLSLMRYLIILYCREGCVLVLPWSHCLTWGGWHYYDMWHCDDNIRHGPALQCTMSQGEVLCSLHSALPSCPSSPTMQFTGSSGSFMKSFTDQQGLTWCITGTPFLKVLKKMFILKCRNYHIIFW